MCLYYLRVILELNPHEGESPHCLGRVLVTLSMIISKCSQKHNLLILFQPVPEFGVVLDFEFSSVAFNLCIVILKRLLTLFYACY